MDRLKSPRHAADHGTFVKAIEAVANSVRELGETGHSRNVVMPLPDSESEAMRELSQQAKYGGAWEPVPVDSALSQVGLLLTAAEDCMRSFARLVLHDDTSLFAHVTLTRAALESLALANYLGEPGVGTQERVRRALNQRIYEAYQAEQLPGAMRQSKDVRKRLLEATAIGFKTKSSKSRITYLLPDRPSVTQHIRMLLTSDDLDAGIYAYTSAVAHGVGWGLLQRSEHYEGNESTSGPVMTQALMHSSGDINTMGLVLLSGHIKAYGSYLKWTGLPAPEWDEARLRAEGVIAAGVAAMREPDDLGYTPRGV